MTSINDADPYEHFSWTVSAEHDEYGLEVLTSDGAVRGDFQEITITFIREKGGKFTGIRADGRLVDEPINYMDGCQIGRSIRIYESGRGSDD